MIVTGDAVILEQMCEERKCFRVKAKLPEYAKEISKNYLRHWFISTRSRLAQLGVFLQKVDFYEFIYNNEIHKMVVPYSFTNFIIELKPNDKVCRFYTLHKSDRVTDEDLIEEIFQENNIKLKDGLVEIPVQPVKYKIVDYPKSMSELEEFGVDKYLERVDLENLVIKPREFVVTESLPVKFPKDIYGVIRGSVDWKNNHLFVLPSSLIDGGFEGRIRFELYNYGDKEIKNPKIEISLYKTKI